MNGYVFQILYEPKQKQLQQIQDWMIAENTVQNGHQHNVNVLSALQLTTPSSEQI